MGSNSERMAALMTNSLTRRWSLFGVMLLLPFFTGCGSNNSPKRGEVSGQVLLNGTPLAIGLIEFTAPDGQQVRSTILNGIYATKAPLGDLKVTVKTSHFTPEFIAGLRLTASKEMETIVVDGGGEEKQANYDAQKQLQMLKKGRRVPRQYENKDTSGLTVSVTESGTKKDFELISK